MADVVSVRRSLKSLKHTMRLIFRFATGISFVELAKRAVWLSLGADNATVHLRAPFDGARCVPRNAHLLVAQQVHKRQRVKRGAVILFGSSFEPDDALRRERLTQ